MRECEKELFSDNNRYIEKGEKYSEGNEVTIGDAPIRMNGLNRIITNQRMIKAVILIISLFYIATVFFTKI